MGAAGLPLPTKKKAIMHHLTIEQTADYLEMAIIDNTIDAGHVLIHTGKNAAGAGFVMMNDANGQTVICESL